MQRRDVRRFDSVRWLGWSTTVLLFLVVPAVAFAQTTGTIEGPITDQSGAPLPGVTVELTGPKLQGTPATVTAADGRYRFLNLVPGDYTVTATLDGFGKVAEEGHRHARREGDGEHPDDPLDDGRGDRHR